MTTMEEMTAEYMPPQFEVALNGEEARAEVLAALARAVDLDRFSTAQDVESMTRLPIYAEDGVHQTNLAEQPTPWDHLRVFGKHETEQLVRSFKIRGAFVACMLAVQRNPELRHIALPSAGNHGLGGTQYVAWHNRQLIEAGQVRTDNHGQVVEEDQHRLLTAHVFCKTDASQEKKDMLAARGAVIHDTNALGNSVATLEDAMLEGETFVAMSATRAAYVHPFDNPEVMAGQATGLLETMLQMRSRGVDLKAQANVFYLGVGGCGLANGYAVALQELIERGQVHPDSQIVGVQVENCDAMNRAQQRLDQGDTDMSDLFMDERGADTFDAWSDGTAVRTPGERGLALAHQLRRDGVLRLMVVSKEELAAELHRDGSREPAGALGEAGMRREHRERTPQWIAEGDFRQDMVAVAVNTGGNMSAATRDHFESVYRKRDERLRWSAGAVASGRVLRRAVPAPTR